MHNLNLGICIHRETWSSQASFLNPWRETCLSQDTHSCQNNSVLSSMFGFHGLQLSLVALVALLWRPEWQLDLRFVARSLRYFWGRITVIIPGDHSMKEENIFLKKLRQEITPRQTCREMWTEHLFNWTQLRPVGECNLSFPRRYILLELAADTHKYFCWFWLTCVWESKAGYYFKQWKLGCAYLCMAFACPNCEAFHNLYHPSFEWHVFSPIHLPFLYSGQSVQ